jgi:hypothetical protein
VVGDFSSAFFVTGEDFSAFFATGDDFSAFFATGDDFSAFFTAGDDFSVFFATGVDFSIFLAAGTSLSSLDEEILRFFFETILIGDASGLEYFEDNIKLVNNVLLCTNELFSMSNRVINGNERERILQKLIFKPFLFRFFFFFSFLLLVAFFGKE